MKARLKKGHKTVTFIVDPGVHLEFIDGELDTDDPRKIKSLEMKNSPWEIINEAKELIEEAKEQTSVSRKSLYDLAKSRGWKKAWRDSKKVDLIEFLK